MGTSWANASAEIVSRRRVVLAVLGVLLSLFLGPSITHANGLTISNVSLTGRNTTTQTINVKFDVTWNNAWKDEINNDAVWIFVKYSQDNGVTWSHATITAAPVMPNGSSIIVTTDQRGCFIQPANYGIGTVTYTGTQITWAYGLNGITDANVISGSSKVDVFGIEMVYIPAGGFYAGDTTTTSYMVFKQGSSDTKPWFIPNANAIHVTNVASGGYYYQSTGATGEFAAGADFWIPQNYPNGYSAFYLMKYKMSQQQYVDFLNTLTRTQQGTRVTSNISAASIPNNCVMEGSSSCSNRDTITCPTSGNGTSPTPVVFSTNSRPSRAANFMEWQDLAAYAGWAGLRPMTELEFEKACRGPNAVVPAEYAWGSTSITACSTISGTEDGTETCTTSSANCTFNNQTFSGGDGGLGPTRVGIFATASSTTRQASGAGFYGNLDLSGSLVEFTVSVGGAPALAFVGSHGDGTLSTNGNATNADWPGYSAGEVTGALGGGSPRLLFFSWAAGLPCIGP